MKGTIYLLALIAISCIVASSNRSVVNAAPLNELIYLDTYNDGSDIISGTGILANGTDYLLTVRGTMSAWPRTSWSIMCPDGGLPELAPQIPSPANRNGKVGLDAEFIFAYPDTGSNCADYDPAPVKRSQLSISTDNGNTWFPPVALSAEYNASHTYSYQITGQEFPLKVRLEDPTAYDNYGVFTLEIQDGSAILTSSYTFPGNSWEVDIGLYVQKNDYIKITATGEIFNGIATFTPDGQLYPPTLNPDAILQDVAGQSLVGSIGDFATGTLLDDGRDVNPAGISGADVGYPGLFGPGYVGSQFEAAASASGYLNFAYNDAPVADNSGSFEIQLTIAREPVVKIQRLEVTQATQCLNDPDCFGDNGVNQNWCAAEYSDDMCDNKVPLVEGKATVVRAYIQCQFFCESIGKARGQLALTGTGQKINSLNEVDLVAVQEFDLDSSRADINRTLNFLLVESLTGDLGDALPSDVEIELLVHESARKTPLLYDEPTTLRFESQNQLTIGHVPIKLNSGPGDESLPNNQNYWLAHKKLLEPILPAKLSSTPREFLPLEIDANPLVYQGEQYNTLLESLLQYRVERPDFDVLVGWLPDNMTISVTNSVENDATWHGIADGKGAPLAVADDTSFRTLAHEIGHELSLGHAPCAVQQGAGWPYDDALIQQWGVKISIPAPTLVSTDTYDFMSYCGDGWSDGASWVSPFSYKAMFDSLQAWAMDKPAYALDDFSTLVVSGQIYADDTAELSPFYLSHTTPSIPPAGTDYCIEFEQGVDVISSYCFDLPFTSHYLDGPSEVETFAFGLPYPPDATDISLKKGGIALGNGLVSITPSTPTITITSPVTPTLSGITEVSWTASDDDGDALSYRVYYRESSEESWWPLSPTITQNSLLVDTSILPESVAGEIKVIATDGVNTGIAVLGDLQIVKEPQAPSVTILYPYDGLELAPGEPLILSGNAFDFEDGELQDDSLVWESDRDGVLGSGELVLAFLSSGLHHITLTATDSSGLTNQDSVTVFVGQKLYLPTISR